MTKKKRKWYNVWADNIWYYVEKITKKKEETKVEATEKPKQEKKEEMFDYIDNVKKNLEEFQQKIGEDIYEQKEEKRKNGDQELKTEI